MFWWHSVFSFVFLNDSCGLYDKKQYMQVGTILGILQSRLVTSLASWLSFFFTARIINGKPQAVALVPRDFAARCSHVLLISVNKKKTKRLLAV